MRAMAAGFILPFAICLALLAQNGGAGDESARILSLESIWNQAEIQHDARALSFLIGDYFVYTDSDGSFSRRAQWLQYIESGVDEYEVIGNSKMEVHVYDSAAVVTGMYREKIKIGGKMVERTGRFKCGASQATLISH
ncbi:MAG TPA: nuclear transport factor 2 family protein [Candidatus Sulfotelmatobacter sp.]